MVVQEIWRPTTQKKGLPGLAGVLKSREFVYAGGPVGRQIKLPAQLTVYDPLLLFISVRTRWVFQNSKDCRDIFTLDWSLSGMVVHIAEIWRPGGNATFTRRTS